MYKDLINLSQAARLLGVTRQTLYSRIRDGALKVVRVLGLPYVRRGDVERLKK